MYCIILGKHNVTLPGNAGPRNKCMVHMCAVTSRKHCIIDYLLYYVIDYIKCVCCSVLPSISPYLIWLHTAVRESVRRQGARHYICRESIKCQGVIILYTSDKSTAIYRTCSFFNVLHIHIQGLWYSVCICYLQGA